MVFSVDAVFLHEAFPCKTEFLDELNITEIGGGDGGLDSIEL
jgi:hypothetical protein